MAAAANGTVHIFRSPKEVHERSADLCLFQHGDFCHGFWHGKNHQLKPPFFSGNCCFWIQASQAIPSCFGLFWVISLGGFLFGVYLPRAFLVVIYFGHGIQ